MAAENISAENHLLQIKNEGGCLFFSIEILIEKKKKSVLTHFLICTYGAKAKMKLLCSHPHLDDCFRQQEGFPFQILDLTFDLNIVFSLSCPSFYALKRQWPNMMLSPLKGRDEDSCNKIMENNHTTGLAHATSH